MGGLRQDFLQALPVSLRVDVSSEMQLSFFDKQSKCVIPVYPL